MFRKYFRAFALMAVASTLFASCVKDDVIDLTNQGNTMIKVMEAPENNLFFSPFTNLKTVDLFTLRKDANSNAELTQPTTVTLTALPGAIDDYNDENGTTFEPLPDSLFTLKNASFVKSGSNYTVTFEPGAFSKEFTIDLNGAKWDIAHTYAIAFAISDAGGKQLAAGLDTIMTFISVKNKYDGVYRLQGYHNRDPYTFPYDTEVELRTAGPNAVIFYWPDVGSTGHPIGTAVGETSWYGAAISPAIVFDPATNLVTSVYNHVPGTVITMFTGAGSRVSKYDPVTKSITVDWHYNNNPLRAFFDDLTFVRERN